LKKQIFPKGLLFIAGESMRETLSQRVQYAKLDRYRVLEELNRIFRSKGIKLKDVLNVMCKSSFVHLGFDLGDLEITFTDGFDECNDYEPDECMKNRIIGMTLIFRNKIEKIRIAWDYCYSVKELESLSKSSEI